MANIKKDPEDVMSRRVPIMMTEEEHETLKKYAEERGMTVSQYVRFRAIYGVKRRAK